MLGHIVYRFVYSLDEFPNISFETLTPIEWGFYNLGILLLLPIAISLRSFWRTGSEDYLVFALYFLGLMGYEIIGPICSALHYPFDLYVLMVAFGELASVYLFLHLLRLGWTETPRGIWLPGIVAFGTIFLGWLLFPLAVDHFNLIVVLYPDLGLGGGIVEGAMKRVCFWLLGLYTYRKIRPHYPTNRIQRVITLWTLFLLLSLIHDATLGVINFLWITVYPEMPLLVQHYHIGVFRDLLYAFAILVIFYIGVRYPEAMLITHTQLLRATKLYALFQLSQRSDTDLSQDQLLAYVSSLSPDLIEELQQT